MWVVRFAVDPIAYGGHIHDGVYLRGPSWLDRAEACLPFTDLEAVVLENLIYVDPFTRLEDAVAAALRLNGTVVRLGLSGEHWTDPADAC